MGNETDLIIGKATFCIRRDIHHDKMNTKKYGYNSVSSIFSKTPKTTEIFGRCIDQAWIKLFSKYNDLEIYFADYEDEILLNDDSIKICIKSDPNKAKIELKIIDDNMRIMGDDKKQMVRFEVIIVIMMIIR